MLLQHQFLPLGLNPCFLKIANQMLADLRKRDSRKLHLSIYIQIPTCSIKTTRFKINKVSLQLNRNYKFHHYLISHLIHFQDQNKLSILKVNSPISRAKAHKRSKINLILLWLQLTTFLLQRYKITINLLSLKNI